MRRIELVDGMRGACLVFMTFTHMIFADGHPLMSLHFGKLGFVSSAEVFILLSGFLVGAIGLRLHRRSGPAVVRRRQWMRAGFLFACNTGMLLAILLAASAWPRAAEIWGAYLGHLADPTPPGVASAVALLYQPSYMDILPLYMLFLALSPIAVHWAAHGRLHWLMGLSVALWLATQTGLAAPLASALSLIVGPQIELRTGFHPLGWQLVYFAGLALGALVADGRADLARVYPADDHRLLWLAAAVCGIAFLWLEAIVLGFVDEKTLERLHWLQSRYVYSPLYVVNAAAFGYLVIWLATLPGRPSASRVAAPLRLLGRVLRAGLTWAPLRLAGRHALPVFCFHVLLAYVVVVVDQTIGPFADATEIAILLACLASMLGVAALSEARDRRSAERRPATAAMRGPGVRA